MPNEHILRVSQYFRDGADVDAGASDGARNVTFTSTAGLASTSVGGALDELKGQVGGATSSTAALQRREFAFNLTATPQAGATTTNIALALVNGVSGAAATASVAAEIFVYRTVGSLHTGVLFTSASGGAQAVYILGGNGATSGHALVTLAAGHGTVSLVQVTGGAVVVAAEPLKAGSGAQIAGVRRYVATTV